MSSPEEKAAGCLFGGVALLSLVWALLLITGVVLGVIWLWGQVF